MEFNVLLGFTVCFVDGSNGTDTHLFLSIIPSL